MNFFIITSSFGVFAGFRQRSIAGYSQVLADWADAQTLGLGGANVVLFTNKGDADAALAELAKLNGSTLGSVRKLDAQA